MRIEDIPPKSMTDAQRRVVAEAVGGKRGRVPGPLRVWLHSPEFGARAQRLGELVRYDTSLGPVLSELAILVTARFWTSHYEWHAHKREALKAGLDPAVVDAIATRQKPALTDTKAQAVYDVAVALHETHHVPTPLYETARTALGEQGLVDLIGVLGYYTMVAMTLNTFEFDLPDGASPELK